MINKLIINFIAENNQKLEERREHLKHKKDELGDILKETEKEENDLLKKIINSRLEEIVELLFFDCPLVKNKIFNSVHFFC